MSQRLDVGDVVQCRTSRVLAHGQVGRVVKVDATLCEVETTCGQTWWMYPKELTIISLDLDDLAATEQTLERIYGERK